jgi:hypothetical protein
MGGSGKEFSEAIGGNDQREQFTGMFRSWSLIYRTCWLL